MSDEQRRCLRIGALFGACTVVVWVAQYAAAIVVMWTQSNT